MRRHPTEGAVRRRPRRLLVLLAALAALLATLAAPALPSGAAEPAVPAAPAITATPSTGLVQGDTVTVAGTGFPASTMLGVIQCIPGGGVEACAMSTLAYVSTNGSGAFSMSFTPRRLITVQGTTYDCADPGQCRIGAGVPPDGAAGSAIAEIQFDGSVPPPPPPSITATPDTGLLDNDSVIVSGENFEPDQFLAVVQCLAPLTDDLTGCRFNGNPVQASPAGTFTISVTVRRVMYVDGVVHDCADPGTCVVAALNYSPAESPTAAIEFDGSVPLPPPPVVTATPDTDLLDGDTLTVTGSGFGANTTVAVIQCKDVLVGPGDASVCNTSAFRTMQTDGSGAVTTDFQVDRILYLPDGAFDCATAPGCRMVVAELPYGYPNASATIAFDASVPPPPPPTLVADPSTGLGDVQTVTVHGSGYPRNRQLGMAQCLTGDQSPSGCDLQHYTFVQTDDTGSFTTTFTVRATYQSDRGPVDCRTSAGFCRIGAGTAPGGIGADALLTFAPVTPPPTTGPDVEAVEVTPSFTG